MSDSGQGRRELELITPSARAILGEGPVWDERTQTLYWVDIDRGEVHHCQADGSMHESTPIGERICCIALRRSQPGFIAGLERSIALISLNPLSIRSFASVHLPSPNDAQSGVDTRTADDTHRLSYRCNDGKCDASGRFWVGTYTHGAAHAADWLFRIDARLVLERGAGPFNCANGPAFSPDGSIAYCVDSYGKVVHRYDLSKSGELSGQKIFRRFDAAGWGFPDGLTSDVSGCIWIAEWGASRVSRFSPAGELLTVIRLPVSQPTSCTFGGPDLKRLFITTASVGLDAASNANGLAGAVFAADVEVGGFPAARFDG